MSRVADLTASRDLMVNLTLRELRGKYKRSILGWTWSLLNPLATMAIFTLVFRYIIGVEAPPGHPSDLDNFALFLLCALLPWNYLANSMNGGMDALVGNANLVKKVYFPREVLVAANVASWGISLLIELVVLAIALLVVGNMVLPWLLLVLGLVALQTLFVLGIALALSVLNVYFRDVRHLVGILLQMWFYLTPIVYPLALVHDHLSGPVRVIYDLNPMVRFVGAYRNLFYDLRFPPVATMAYLVVVSVAFFAAGWAIFNRLEPRLAEEL